MSRYRFTAKDLKGVSFTLLIANSNLNLSPKGSPTARFIHSKEGKPYFPPKPSLWQRACESYKKVTAPCSLRVTNPGN